MKLIRKNKCFFIVLVFLSLTNSSCGIKGKPLPPLEPLELKTREALLKEQTEKAKLKKNKSTSPSVTNE